MLFTTVVELQKSDPDHHECGSELAPGVVVQRRLILRLGLSAAGMLSLRAATSAGQTDAADDTTAVKESRDARPRLLLSEMVAALHPQARELIHAALPDEVAYLATVRQLLLRVRPEPAWDMRPAGKDWSMDTTCWMPPLAILSIHMEPGAAIQLHDHRHYNGVLLCLKGKVRCRNFEYFQNDGKPLNVAAGEVPAEGSEFLIRQTRDEWLRPRGMSSLSRDRDNLHTITAGDSGCELIDVFTHFRPEARSYELDWDETPVDKEAMTFKAAWKQEDRE